MHAKMCFVCLCVRQKKISLGKSNCKSSINLYRFHLPALLLPHLHAGFWQNVLFFRESLGLVLGADRWWCGVSWLYSIKGKRRKKRILKPTFFGRIKTEYKWAKVLLYVQHEMLSKCVLWECTFIYIYAYYACM